MVLSDTLSNFDMLNYGEYSKYQYGEYSKYQLCPQKIEFTCFYAIFQRQIDLKRSYCDTGYQMLLDTSATSSRSTTGSTASTSYVHQKLIWLMLTSYDSKTYRFKVVPGESRCSWTPSVTSTSSTMVSTASTSYVHQKLISHMFIHYHNWYFLYPPWLSLSRSLRVSESAMTTLVPF